MEIDPLAGVVQQSGRLAGAATLGIDIALTLIRQRARFAEARADP